MLWGFIVVLAWHNSAQLFVLQNSHYCEIPGRWWTMYYEYEYSFGKCYEVFLLFSPSTTQHNHLFFKIPIFVKFLVGDGLCITNMSIHLENVMRFFYCSRLAQLSTTIGFSKFPFLWNSGSVMFYVFRKWVFIWKILIWLKNVIRVNYCTRLAQLGATFSSSKFPLLWNSWSVMDCVFRKWLFLWKILIWLENVMRIYYCTRLAQLGTNFCPSKFPLLWNSGSVMDYVFENEYSFGKYWSDW